MKELIINKDFDNINYIIENDVLYLDADSIKDLSGSPLSTVKDNCKQVLEEYQADSDFSRNFGLSLYIDKKTGGRPRRFYSHYIAGDVLHRLKSPKAIKFRIWANEKTFRKPEQPDNQMQEAIEIIQWLEDKIHEETKLALNAKTNKESEMHVDLACKYELEAKKCRFQLENVENCTGKFFEHIRLIKQGILTESDDRRVFLPGIQTTLLD